MNNRGAVVERSCVRRKDLCARSEIVVYSAVRCDTDCCMLCIGIRALRSGPPSTERRQARHLRRHRLEPEVGRPPAREVERGSVCCRLCALR